MFFSFSRQVVEFYIVRDVRSVDYEDVRRSFTCEICVFLYLAKCHCMILPVFKCLLILMITTEESLDSATIINDVKIRVLMTLQIQVRVCIYMS